MLISKNKRKLIEANFFEFTFEEDKQPNFEVFKKLNSIELHYLAAIYNWDDGVEVLNWIIDSPKCLKATASLLFWRSEPDHYTQYNDSNVDEMDEDVYHLVRKILNKFITNSFKKSFIGFDPVKDGADVNYKRKDELWSISKKIKTKVPGVSLFA